MNFDDEDLLAGERLYYQGEYKEALRHFQIAVRNNNPRAMYYQGLILKYGFNGVEKNVDLAYESFAKGANFGYHFCSYVMARQLPAKDEEFAQKCFREIFNEILLLAEDNDKEAQLIISYMYSGGFGVECNEEESIRWNRKLAEVNYHWGQYNLGIKYEVGSGVGQDYSEALKWYKKAANQGNSIAMNMIGIIFELGYGVSQSKDEAYVWYKKAADLGNEDAKTNINRAF